MAHCAYCNRDNHPAEQIICTDFAEPIYFCDIDHQNRWQEDLAVVRKAIKEIETPTEPVVETPPEPVTAPKPAPKRRGRPPKAQK